MYKANLQRYQTQFIPRFLLHKEKIAKFYYTTWPELTPFMKHTLTGFIVTVMPGIPSKLALT